MMICSWEKQKYQYPDECQGEEVENRAERRVEGTAGQNLVTSIDINIQQYITQKALEVLEKKQAKRVCIIVMNPQNGEIYALADVPEYNLNDPFTLNYETDETVTQICATRCGETTVSAIRMNRARPSRL